MGVIFSNSTHHYSFRNGKEDHPLQVLKLAIRAIDPLVEDIIRANITQMVVATTCPDMLAPSLSQMLMEHYSSVLGTCTAYDLVQGCAGGVAALILGSQLAESRKEAVLVVQCDAASKATSEDATLNAMFGNGAYAVILSYKEDNNCGLLYSGSRQYQGLSDVVTVRLGHDADEIIMQHIEDMKVSPRRHLGLKMNDKKAIRLFREAEQFYLDFVKEREEPEIMILHQVNPLIIRHLKEVFSRYQVTFIDVAEETGNCGAATVGVAVGLVREQLEGRKVMLCSFGTGGVITAGLWQM